MKIAIQPIQKQARSLNLTPRLQQAIRLLEFSNVGLSKYLEEEAEQNPFLELKYDSNQINSKPRPPKEQGTFKKYSPTQRKISKISNNTDNANYSEKAMSHEVEKKINLRDHLTNQLNMEMRNATEKKVGLYIIDRVNSAGYFLEEESKVAKNLGIKETVVKDVLEKLQSFEPSGIFAKNLSQCLLMQLKEKKQDSFKMKLLLENLHLLEKANFSKICKICNVSKDTLLAMIKLIKTLNPKPGEIFINQVAEAIIPDILLTKDSSNTWKLKINEETLPQVFINQGYAEELKNKISTQKEKSFIAQHLESANWLIKTIQQRAETLLKVTSKIIKIQKGFFDQGIEKLKPLILKEVAESIKIHESTVSRVTSNKYIGTPTGNYELKFFFSPAVKSLNLKDNFSSKSVQFKVKKLINNEAKEKPLTDNDLVRLLQEKGIKIARRTIAKYREGLGIPASTKRKDTRF
jgi:RNA polymerase sigma-54 factor|tara:strand:- start:580 stop:1968 length:1389 start_codon:yes stop_codon:yes gene_type:complete